MAGPPRRRTRIPLLAAMTTGLATLPPYLTAQAGSGEPGRSLAAWVSAAREGPFHVPAGPGARENPAVASADGIGTANTREFRWRPPPAPDSAVSPKRVFAFTLAGATIPLLPAMYYGASLVWGDEGRSEFDELELLLSMAGGGLLNLVTVPVAAYLAGVESIGRALGGTVYGVGIASMLTILATSLPAYESWMPPVFSLTVAAFTTAITTAKKKEAWRPPRGVGAGGRTSR